MAQAAVREIEALIYGRVTGVMFRDFVRRQAASLNLVGTVKNLADNSVQVIAQGDESSLRQLLAVLHRGPLFARVDKVEVIWRDPNREFTSFQIVY